MRYYDKCDKYDFLTAIGTGALAGIIDIFLVGSPADSKLLNWTDKQVDNCVKSFAKTMGWNSDNNVNNAIGYLEKKFPVNYDQRHSGDVGGVFQMSAKNHHMKSLAHSPDVIGLFFSILNQFTGTSSFISNGKLITISTATQELKGGNFIAKIFCGTVNWFGHLMSDIAGSSSATGRGSGIVMPFYELFGLFEGTPFNNIAEIATKAFEEGYDARFGLTMAIPVLVSDLLTRFIWGLRHYFQYKKPIKECIPTKEHDDLRVMLIVSNGCLCFMDTVDAGIRSGFSNPVVFFSRLNLVAWGKLLVQIVKEVAIRCKRHDEYDSVAPELRIDEESKQIFLESSWKQIVNGGTVSYHVSSFWFYHKRKNERKANRNLALAIVLATNEGIDTEEMINIYFSNDGSAEYLGQAFMVGWFCSPNYDMAKKYIRGDYTFDFVEVDIYNPEQELEEFKTKEDEHTEKQQEYLGSIVNISKKCVTYLTNKGILKNIPNHYDVAKGWEIIEANPTQYRISKNINGREITAWVKQGNCIIDSVKISDSQHKKDEYITKQRNYIGKVVKISKKCVEYLNSKGILKNIPRNCDIKCDWEIIDCNDTQYMISKNINGREITAWVKHGNCII